MTDDAGFPNPLADLAARIRDRIREDGPLTFAQFMETALYDPELGFYARPPVGGGRDFVSSHHVSPAFGVLVARQLEEFWDLLGKPEPFWVVEVGAGDGTLAGQILDFMNPETRQAIRYVAVERSAAARRAMEGLDALVLADVQEVPPGLVGCVLANELLDNLPFHRLRGAAGGPVELHVGLEGDPRDPNAAFVLVEGPVSNVQAAEMVPDLAPGDEAVVGLAALDLLDQATALIDKGYLWLVDYGFTGGRRSSSVHGYRAHRVVDDILSQPGATDITAGVDFHSLAEHLRRAGHTVWGPVSQRDVLIALGYRRRDEDA